MKTINKIIFMDDANTFINKSDKQEIKDFFSKILSNLRYILNNEIECEIDIPEAMNDVEFVCFYQFMTKGAWKLYQYQMGKGVQEELKALNEFYDNENTPYPIRKVKEQIESLDAQNSLLIFCDFKWTYAPEEYRNMPDKVFEIVKDCANCFLIYYTSIEPEAAQEFVDKIWRENSDIKCQLLKDEWSVSKYAKSSGADMDKTIFNLYNVVAELKK